MTALCLLLEQRAQLPAVQAQEKQQRCGNTDKFRNGEGPPHKVDIARQTQQEGSRQQGQHLAAQGDEGGINTDAHGLKAGDQANADGGQREVKTDDPQGNGTNGQEGLAGLEDA